MPALDEADGLPPDIGIARAEGYTRVWQTDGSAIDMDRRDYEHLCRALDAYDRFRPGDQWYRGVNVYGAHTRVRLDTITSVQDWSTLALKNVHADAESTKRPSWADSD